MLSMFVLMSCLDHLERHQPLGLDRIHQIVNHVCKSSCRLVIRQPRSPLCQLFCHACTLLNGVGVQCILGSSGAGSKADPIVQPCLASMAWRKRFASLFAFRTNLRRCRRFRAVPSLTLASCKPLQCLGLYLNLPESHLCTPLC